MQANYTYRAFVVLLLLLFNGIGVFAQLTDSIFLSKQTLVPLNYINSTDGEFSPTFYKEGLAYILFKQKTNEDRPIRGEFDFDIMYTDTLDSYPFADNINSSFVEGPFCFVNDTMFLTRGNSVISENNQRKLKIYKSILGVDGTWSKPKRIDFPTGDYNFCHPTLNEQGDMMILASDMIGGFGKMDLYITIKINGHWTRPENLGPAVNGPGNDWYPCLVGDLFFYASNSFSEKGDLDIYQAIFDNNFLVDVELLGHPINTNYDDFGVALHSDGEQFVFSSNRNPKEKDNLFQLNLESSILLERVPDNQLLELTIIDHETLESISNVDIKIAVVDLVSYELDDYDVNVILREAGNIVHPTSFILKSNIEGEQDLMIDTKEKYVVILKKDNYKENRFFYDPLVDDPLWMIMMIPKDPLEIKVADIIEEPLVELIIPTEKGEAIIFNNIYYEYNSTKVVEGAQMELDALVTALVDHPNMKILLTAHTDSRGKDLYNKTLSEDRAISAKQYLREKGIESDRISTMGLGESMIRNHCINNVDCTEDEHKYNRRTEVTILDN